MKTRSSSKRKEIEESYNIEETNTKKLKSANKKTTPAPKKKEKTKESEAAVVVTSADTTSTGGGDNEEKKDCEKVILQRIEPITRQIIKWDQVDTEELDSLLYPDIREIAKSIGISAVGIRKQLLIEKIKFIISMNSDAVKSQINKDNSNPFNKSTFSQLVISPNKQGQDELLFWKIFKNKSIYKHIMSFMNVLPNPVGYDFVISAFDMLTNNQIGLFKEKVKRNQYISFNEHSKSYTLGNMYYPNYRVSRYRSSGKVLPNMMYSLTKDDESFYQSLFKYYMVQITNGTGDLREVSAQLIETNCLVGFKVLIANHGYQPTEYDFVKAVQYNSTEIITFINEMLKLNDGDITGTLSLEYNKSLKLEENIESFKQFVNTYKTVDIELKETTNKWFKSVENPFSITLSNLVGLVGLLQTDSQWDLFKNSFFILPDFCDHNSKFTTTALEKIKEEIGTFEFSDQQLESNVNDQINYSSAERDNIRMLLHVFFKVHFYNRWYQFKWGAEFFVCYSDEFIVGEINEEKLKKCRSTVDPNYTNIPLSALNMETIQNYSTGLI